LKHIYNFSFFQFHNKVFTYYHSLIPLIKMNSYFLLYDGFSGYEMVFPAFILRKTNVKTVGLKDGRIISEENMGYTPDFHISEINVDDVDIFIIPGGSALQHLNDNSLLPKLLNELHSKNKVIAAICGGPVLLANTSVLENKRFTAGGGELPENWQKNFTKGKYVIEDVVVDENIITAKGVAVASFAVAIGKKMGIFSSAEQEKQNYELIKEIR